MTFEERFCAIHGVDAAGFRRRVFWHTVPPLLLPLAVGLRWVSSDFFRSDEELLYGVGEACTLDDVRREARDYLGKPANQAWLRRVARIRISRRRLVRLAHDYVSASPAVPAV